MVLLQSRGALASTNEALATAENNAAEATQRLSAARAEVDQLTAEIDTRTGELAAVQADLQAKGDEADGLRDELIGERKRIEELQEQLEAAVEARDSLEAELAARDGEVVAVKTLLEKQQEVTEASDNANLELTHQNETLQVQLLEAADEAAKRSSPSVPAVLVSDDGSDLDVPGFSPGMAWDLELVRSERTWRYSVAANPVEDPNPFIDTDNSLRLAIEVEALALREDVGAFIGIDWQAGNDIDPAADPARAHLTLRLAQELLASAARELSPSTLVVTSDAERGGVSLEVVASDPDDVDFKIPPPPIASEWIGIDEHGGMVVTVKATDR